MQNMLITNAIVYDGTGAPAVPGHVRIEGNRISAVALTNELIAADGAQVVDANGAFLMPGLIEGHGHISFINQAELTDLALIEPEEHLLATMHNARLLLDAGFTSVNSAASAKLRLEVVIRNEINAGRIPGPRLRAASPEITVTSGLGDTDKMHMKLHTFGLVANGEAEITAAVRLCIREGVDNIKLNISGDIFMPNSDSHTTVMSENEVKIAVDTAHAHGKRVAAHCRAADSVKRAVRCGVDMIYHCDHADEEALDLLEAAKDRILTGPAISVVFNAMKALESQPGEAAAQGAAELREVFENSCWTHNEMRKRGIPIVIGGDYGFAVNPQGTNARDFELFMEHFGFTANEALQAGTRIGAKAMCMEHELGLIKAGYLADMLLIDGNPLEDIRVLQDSSKFQMILKDGVNYGNTPVLD